MPASTRIMPLSWRTAVMFLPISPTPPSVTTFKFLLSTNSSYNLLLKASGYRQQASGRFADAYSIQIPSQIELLRTDGGEVQMVCSKVLSGEASDVLRGHRLDAGGDLLWRQELGAGNYAAADAIHPRRGALQCEERRALELLLGTIQFLFIDRLLHDPPELLDDHFDRLLHIARGRTDVGLDRAGVRVSLVVGVDGVCQPALLAHLLKQAAAHASSEDVVQSGHRVAILALGRDAEGAQRDMVLLRLLELEEDAALGRGRPRFTHERLPFGQPGQLLFDHAPDIVGVELACRDHEDVWGRVGLVVEGLQGIVVDAAHGLGRPDDRAAQGVLVEDQRREVLIGELVGPVLVHLDLFDDDLTLPLQVRERRPEDHVAHEVEGPLDVLGQKAGVEHGVFLAGRRILLGSYALEGLGDAERVHLGRPLEEHVLHQVADPGELLRLVAGAGPDPEPQRDARRLGEGLREDPESPRKYLQPNVRVGH